VADQAGPDRTGTDIATRAKDIEDGIAAIVRAGLTALANPDLVERIRTGAQLNTCGRPPSTAAARRLHRPPHPHRLTNPSARLIGPGQ
jgi:2,4-dienoyl-CoA reductase-like NADH-dependent reductase (Old Yellow Enzyme family)